jgi:hypothetical protein
MEEDGRGSRRDTETKTRTPHKDVENHHCFRYKLVDEVLLRV